MKIFVDADACPVTRIVEKLAKKYEAPCCLLCCHASGGSCLPKGHAEQVAGPVGDTNHVLNSDYSETIVVGAGADAVDFKLISLLQRGDICVSQDY